MCISSQSTTTAAATTTATKNVRIVLPSHSCGVTLQSLCAKLLYTVQLSVDAC